METAIKTTAKKTKEFGLKVFLSLISKMFNFLFMSFFKPTRGAGMQNFAEVAYTRLVYSVALVIFTYNPSEKMYCLTRWIQSNGITDSISIVVMIAAAIAWGLYFYATYKALGKIGIVVMSIFFGAVAYAVYDKGLISFENGIVVQWFIIGCLSTLFSIGLSGSELWKRFTGQVTTNEGGDGEEDPQQ